MVDRAADLTKKYTIPFPVLSDPEAEVHKAFGVVHSVDDTEFDRLRSFGIEIEQWSEHAHHKIAVPAIFLVGEDGRIAWAHAAYNHRVRPSMEQLFAALDGLAE